MENTDHSGELIYAANFKHMTALSIGLVVTTLLMTASLAVNIWLFKRPPQVAVIRINQLSTAQALVYQSNDYTPQEGEIRSALNDWAVSRFRLLQSVLKDFPRNYYFLDGSLSKTLRVTDADVTSRVQAGSIGEQDVQINNISFRAFDKTKLADGTVGSGEVVIDMFKIYNAMGPGAREHWVLTLKYKVNPSLAAKTIHDPAYLFAYQMANPLGVQITWFHEDKAL
jgi:hypothetical protein